MAEVIIQKIKPKTLKQKREYLKSELDRLDVQVRNLKSDRNAVQTNSFARSTVSDYDLYMQETRARLDAFKNKRQALTRQLHRTKKALKNQNRAESGRPTI